MRGAILVALLMLPGAAQAAGERADVPELVQHDTAVGDFVQRRELPELERPIVSRGRFAYSARRGLLWLIEEPVESRLVIDAEGVHQDGEPVRGSGALEAIRPLLESLFRGDLAPLEDGFSVTREDAGEGWRLVLDPRDDQLARALDRVIIEGVDTPRRLVITTSDGDRTELEFTDVTHPERLDEALIQAFERVR
ncbi:MAG: LolA family protein [Halofilum sp. (in: g-proteobacteria)]